MLVGIERANEKNTPNNNNNNKNNSNNSNNDQKLVIDIDLSLEKIIQNRLENMGSIVESNPVGSDSDSDSDSDTNTNTTTNKKNNSSKGTSYRIRSEVGAIISSLFGPEVLEHYRNLLKVGMLLHCNPSRELSSSIYTFVNNPFRIG